MTAPTHSNKPGRIRAWFATASWYLNGMMGGHAYERYVNHLHREHPDATPMSEREFWRQKARDEDANPSARCC
ncbi:YbdD/YjiX family protein [Gulosibacter sediminis]|uniref:YbdD/YjiX family protein n=1 Tax=Gulosibacter sediminis TaxID=1729695 RepID=UPI0024A882D3|nr:YbdD/YjiX family protein [Gulosibacter sediminis]